MTAHQDDLARQATRRAIESLNEDRLRELVHGLVDHASAPGEEGALTRWAAQAMSSGGLNAWYQEIDEWQGNAVARLRGTGRGPSLLLYAPIDTLTSGVQSEDWRLVGHELRSDMLPKAVDHGPYVLGLGASNPKGHAACVLAAAEAIGSTGFALAGDLLVGLGAGGMPTNRRLEGSSSRENVAQGSGCSFMLEQGHFPDMALIAKPGWAVSWEEVGLSWFEVTVSGTFNYVGSRHRVPYVNPIVQVTKVIEFLEEWFCRYGAENTDGLVAPQGQIGAIDGGLARMPAVSPSSCRVFIDLRTNPRNSPGRTQHDFALAMEELRARHPDLEFQWSSILAIPGTVTDKRHWIVRSAIRAWEAMESVSHTPIVATSGATDANILRSRGVPTARVGMDRIGADAPIPVDFASGMNVVDIREMRKLTEHLIRTAIDTCSRSRAEVGIE